MTVHEDDLEVVNFTVESYDVGKHRVCSEEMKQIASWRLEGHRRSTWTTLEVNSRRRYSRIQMVTTSRYNLRRVCDPYISWWVRCNYAFTTTGFFQTSRSLDLLDRKRRNGRPRLGGAQRRSNRKSTAVSGTILLISYLIKITRIIPMRYREWCHIIIHRTSPASKISRYAETFCRGTIGIWKWRFKYIIFLFYNILLL